MEERLIAVKCRLSKGIFSSERAFEVVLANGDLYTGPVPRHFCWNASGRPLGETEAIASEIDGWVAGRRVSSSVPPGQLAVEVPDGAVLAVRPEQVGARPTPISPPSVKTPA
jgi:hypothetical protein